MDSEKRSLLSEVVFGTVTVGALLFFFAKSIGSALLSFVTLKFLRRWWK